MRASLRMYLREIGVHVEHPRIGVAEESEAGGTQAAHGVRRLEPVTDELPCAVAVEQRAGDRTVRNPRTRECAGELRDATCRAVGKPLARCHPFVVERARRLQVQD